MNIIALDNKRLLYGLICELDKVFPKDNVVGFDNSEEVLSYAKRLRGHLDYAFMDTKLKEMSGIQFARELKELKPETKIIFCTANPDYALEAFQVDAVGYIMKPITEEKIRKKLEGLQEIIMNPPMRDECKLIVRTFGNFETFMNGKPLRWEREKAKELLAYLIDRRGAVVSNKDIAIVLWADESKTRNVQTVMSSLRKTLKNAGCEDILIKGRNATAVDTKKVYCDLYDFLRGNSWAVNAYHGEYMEQYEWAKWQAS